jgi:asparagine synthase (glutamine-hydrolysing)
LKGAFKVVRNRLLPGSVDPRFEETTLSGSPINPRLADELHMLDRYREFALRPPGEFRASKWRDFNQFDVGDYHFSARNSWGIDNRDPTADKRVLAYCIGIPMEQYVAGGINRSLIRRAMKGRLPESTLNQPLKGLQFGDWYESLTPILPEMIVELGRIERSSMAQRILDLPRLRETLENWPRNATEAVADQPRFHDALTRGIAYGYFLRQFEGIE